MASNQPAGLTPRKLQPPKLQMLLHPAQCTETCFIAILKTFLTQEESSLHILGCAAYGGPRTKRSQNINTASSSRVQYSMNKPSNKIQSKD